MPQRDETASEEPAVCLANGDKCSQNGGATCCDGLECRKTYGVCTQMLCPDDNPDCNSCTEDEVVCMPKRDETASEEPKVCLARYEECSQNGGSTCCDGLECRKTPQRCTMRGCPPENPDCNYCSGGNEVCIPTA